MITEIKANFKELKIKAGTAQMNLEVLPSAKGFTDLTKMTGQAVFLTVESEQEEIPFGECGEEAIPFGEEAEEEIEEVEAEYAEAPSWKPENVDFDTGEVYPEITDEKRMIGDGNGIN